jgi:chromosome condensin MukBEF ATPase and DNA-binding subunit MukB
MKSAYDLAMERLEKQSPTVKLTEEQRSQLAEIDSLYKSRIAEKELLLNDLIRREQAAGKISEVESLQKQLASEIRRLSEECESKKERIRQGITA